AGIVAGPRGAIFEDQRAAPRGAERDATPARGLRRRFGGEELEALEHGAHDDAHLDLREARAEAAAASAPERDPRVGAGRGLEGALWAQRVGVWVDVRVVVDEVGAREDRDARRVVRRRRPRRAA